MFLSREDQFTEFKREYIDDIKLTVIAFANTNGGTLYIGVEDDGTICGLRNPEEVILQIQNTLRDSILPDIMMFVQCSFLDIDGKTIIKIQVHRGTKRPYFLRGKGIRRDCSPPKLTLGRGFLLLRRPPGLPGLTPAPQAFARNFTREGRPARSPSTFLCSQP